MQRFLLLFACFVFFTFSHCEKDRPCDDPTNPLCPNYDPCIEYEPANADFVVLDSVVKWDCDGTGPLSHSYAIDTGLVLRDYYFQALHHHDSYEWQIGSDSRTWNDAAFALYFGTEGEGAIPVTLTVTKNDPDNCLTEEQRISTITKTIYSHFWDGTENEPPPIVGKYTGANTDAPQDTFTIEVPTLTNGYTSILNLPKDCPEKYTNLALGWNYFLYKNNIISCEETCAKGLLQEDHKTLIVDYSIEIDGERVKNQFVGIKK